MSKKIITIAVLNPQDIKIAGVGKIFLTAIIMAGILKEQKKTPVITEKGFKTVDATAGVQVVVVPEGSNDPLEMTNIITFLLESSCSSLPSVIGKVAGEAGIFAKEFKQAGIEKVQRFIEELPEVEVTAEVVTLLFKMVNFASIDKVLDGEFDKTVGEAKADFVWHSLLEGIVRQNETTTFVETKFPLLPGMVTKEVVEKYVNEKNITTDIVILSRSRELTTSQKTLSIVTITDSFDITEKEISNLCGLKKSLTTEKNGTKFFNFFTGELTSECRESILKTISAIQTALTNSKNTYVPIRETATA